MYKVGILVADIDEYIFIKEQIERNNGCLLKTPFSASHTVVSENGSIVALCCGIGKVNAASAATYLVSIGCNVIFNFGYSGGISGVKRGDMIVADRFFEHDFDLTPLGYKMCQKPSQEYIYDADKALVNYFTDKYQGIVCGTAATGDCFVSDSTVRDRLRDDYKALCCDMETAAIASVANLFKIPFISIRQISDDAGDNANDNYKQSVSLAVSSMGEMIFTAANDVLNGEVL